MESSPGCCFEKGPHNTGKHLGDEFIFIHSSGEINNKTEWINCILSTGNYSPASSFDELYVYGGAALLRVKGVNRGTTIYAKKNGQWQVVQVQSTATPPERKTIQLDPKILDQYAGITFI